MTKKTLFILIAISLLTLVGCLSRYPLVELFDPNIDLNNVKVGLIVKNNTGISVPDLKKTLAEGFVQAIRWDTLYDIEIVEGKKSDYPYLLTISVEEMKGDRGGLWQIKLRATITDTQSHTTLYDATFDERIKKKANFYQKIVKHFPNYPQQGLPPGQNFHWLNASEETPSQADYPDAAALYLVDEADWNIQIKRPRFWTPLTKYGSFYTTETRHVAVKILNERGFKYAEVLVPFSEHTHIEKLEARTITKDKRIIEVAPDQIYTVDLFPEFVFFSDAKAKKFTFPALEAGSIIEYMYTAVTESVALWGGFSFQKPEPVLRASFSLDVPAGMEFRRAFHCPDYLDETFKQKINLSSWATRGAYREKSSSKTVRKTTQYELLNIPPVPLEEGMPPWGEVSARLTFCSATFGDEGMLCNFQELGNWYAKLVQDAFISQTPLHQKAYEITKNQEQLSEKIRSIYHYIQEHYRYVAVEFGIGKIVPQSPDEVDKARYGDCKGLSALMISMLRSIGIKAYPALLRTKDEGALDEDYIALAQFNHMILYVDEKEGLWFDPTAKSCAFGDLPWQDQGVKALVVRPDDSYLVTTPTSTAKDNSIKTEWDVKLHADGKLTCQVQTNVTGQGQFFFRSALGQLSDKEQKDWMSQRVSQIFPKAQLTSYQGGNLKEKDAPLALSYQFETADALQKVGELLLFPLPLETIGVSFTKKERTHPIIFDYPYHQIDEMKIHLPAGYTVEELPEAVDIKTEFGTLKISLTKEQGSIIYRREILWDATSIPASEYEKLCQFQQKLASTQRKNIVLKRNVENKVFDRGPSEK